MSQEDLERYETEVELGLYQEYKAVLPLFRFVVETERRFYLANGVSVAPRSEAGLSFVEVELRDAWVWDMYRPVRFVDHVKVLSFRDVNVEELPRRDLH
jgi:hypothetical protein